MTHSHTYQEPHRYVVWIILIASLSLIFLFGKKSTTEKSQNFQVMKGRVVEVLSEKEIDENEVSLIGATKEQELLVEVKVNGENKRVKVRNDFTRLKAGDRIFLRSSSVEDGQELFEMVEVSRTKGIFWLLVFFIILVILISGKKGFHALVGLVFTFAIIFSFIIPRILNGKNAVSTALIGSFFILLVTLYVSYGFNKKSLSALFGITLTLFFVGLFAQFTIQALNFTGFGSEEASYLKQEIGAQINFIGLLVAGIIIAAIGVLDDIAVTQASIVFTLFSANPSMTSWEAFKKAMWVGKDHISAVINTLVLAYTGAALPLVLLFSFYKIQAGYVVSIEIVAEEIVRTLISSTGLVLAVPITTFIAAFWANKKFIDGLRLTSKGGKM